MIVVTGGAGFIGSAVVWRLNQIGFENIVIVDRLDKGEKWKNLNGLKYEDVFHKDDFYEMITNNAFPYKVDSVIHLGACSSTTETDADYLLFNNFQYSQALARFCFEKDARFVYASSAATYGDGAQGYSDNEEEIENLRPLNMYGYSKQMFDLWVKKNGFLSKAAGIKYFNVYGPNEYHKGDMRSVVHKAFGQIRKTGKVKLFKSYISDYKDGEQMRDFIYVKDAVDMTLFLWENKNLNGIFNVGTGEARTWNDLVKALFDALEKPVNIEYIEMPEYLRPKYQYFTQADVSKIRKAGFNEPLFSLEEGVEDYVRNYLLKNEYLAW